MFVTFVFDNCDQNAESICIVTLYGTNGIQFKQVNMNFMGWYHTLLNFQLADDAYLNLSRDDFSHTSKANIVQTHC